MDALRGNDPTGLGPYVLQARLGAGGMGQVYLGRSPGGRLVALKVIRDEITEHPEALVRFRREVETARAVRSAYTANLIDASLDEAPYWLATEYVQGPTLSSAVAERGPLPAETCRGLFAALAEGLAAVHACGVTHRDLKPQNVILSQRGPQLIDFGIARGAEQTAVTEDGAAGPGTPGFTAPEVLMRNEVGPAADVFALGATVAYAATGRPPFGTGPAASVGYRAVYEPIDLAGVEEGLAGLVQACVAKDPAARPSLAQVIERCAVSGALVGDVHYAALAGTGAVPQPAAAPAPGGAPVPAVPAAAPPAAPHELPTSDGYTPTRLDGPAGPVGRRRRAWTVVGAAVLAAAVTGGVLAAIPDGGDDGGKGERAASGAGSDGKASASPVGGGGGGAAGAPAYIEATGPNRDQWTSDPRDPWNGGRCNLPPEETSQHFQYGKPSEPADIASGRFTVAMRLSYAEAEPGETYYVAAVVKPPHDIPAAEAEATGIGLIENRALGFTSRPVDLYAGHSASETPPWVKLTYPDDFSLYVKGERRGGALALREDPGDWTVRFVHVKGPTEFTGIACDGFTVPE
ncbi:serine/threonine-protein kinase [Streptomyces sp. MJP52]|uniref:serine/threonine-protein kinase n=1 Tax=Streptomyces sp. MJP52 TaxID=2940555 RepID=UPI0024759305|nr:serine/threonine-protein kinase [Streptomyces sp. MJP52]